MASNFQTLQNWGYRQDKNLIDEKNHILQWTEVFKTRLLKTLSYVVWPHNRSSFEQKAGLDDVPSNLTFPMISMKLHVFF